MFVYSAIDLACAAVLVLAFIGRVSYGGHVCRALVQWLLGTPAFPSGSCYDPDPVLPSCSAAARALLTCAGVTCPCRPPNWPMA